MSILQHIVRFRVTEREMLLVQAKGLISQGMESDGLLPSRRWLERFPHVKVTSEGKGPTGYTAFGF